MAVRVDVAMVFAAGFGVRLRPLTDHTPKPLLHVAGRSMLDRALDHLETCGVSLAVVNTHHLAAQIHDALRLRRRRGPEVVLVHEQPILETGGGLVNALRLLGDRPFISLNADVVWTDGAEPALRRLIGAFDAQRMDGLLLLQPVETAHGYHGAGDFALEPGGQLRRHDDGSGASYVFTGVQIWHPRVFRGRRAERFSLAEIYRERATADGRLQGLHGLVHDGQWLHVGTEPDLRAADAYLSVHE